MFDNVIKHTMASLIACRDKYTLKGRSELYSETKLKKGDKRRGDD